MTAHPKMSLSSLPQEPLALIASHLDSSEREKLAQIDPALSSTLESSNDAFWADVYDHRYGKLDKSQMNVMTPSQLIVLHDIADDFLLYCPIHTRMLPGCQSEEYIRDFRASPLGAFGAPQATSSLQSSNLKKPHVASSLDTLRVSHGDTIFCAKFRSNGNTDTKRLTADTEVTSLCLSSGGATCGGLSNGVVMVWEPGKHNGNDARRVKGHTGKVTAVEYEPDGVLISGATDSTIRIRRKERQDGNSNGSGARVLRGHVRGARWLKYQGDGKLASHGGLDGCVKLWDVEAGACLSTARLPANISSAESHKGVIYVVDKGSIHVLDSRQGFASTVGILSLPETWEKRNASIEALTVRSDDTLVGSAGAGRVAVWDARGSWRARGMQYRGGGVANNSSLSTVYSEGRSILTTGGRGELVAMSLDGVFQNSVLAGLTPGSITAIGRAHRMVWLVRDAGVVQILDLHRSLPDWSDVIEHFIDRQELGASPGFSAQDFWRIAAFQTDNMDKEHASTFEGLLAEMGTHFANLMIQRH